MKRFSQDDVTEALRDHEATVQIFSKNGVRIYVCTKLTGRITFKVEKVGMDPDDVEVFVELFAAARRAEELQR